MIAIYKVANMKRGLEGPRQWLTRSSGLGTFTQFSIPVLETGWRPGGQSLGLGYEWVITSNALSSCEMLSFQTDLTNASVPPTPPPTLEGIKGKRLLHPPAEIVQ